jgi:hypothetical protein
MTVEEWVGTFADEVGVAAPTQEEVDQILRIAAIAAHATERIAAPIACWLAGSSGRSLRELLETAEGLETGA